MLLLALLMGAHPGGDGHGHDHGHHHNHGNPADLADYIAKMEDPARDAWQKPDEVLRALGVSAGQTVCDIGAGPGYFTLRFAKAVGEAGRVYAVDVEPEMLEALGQRLSSAGVRNVTPVFALPDHALLPERSCDLAVIIDTFHHFPDGIAYLRQLARAVKPGGRIVNIDFHKRDLAVGPPFDHKIAREDFLGRAEAAGLRVIAEPTFLPHQYFLVMQPAGDARATELSHALTILAVGDLPRAVRFYAGFGWRRGVDTPVYVEFAMPGGQRLGLYQRESFGKNTGQVPAQISAKDLAPTELYFYATDVEAAVATLRKAGARELDPLRRRDWGDEAAYFADPDGNVIVVARPMP